MIRIIAEEPVSDPRFGNREHIIIGLEGIPALPVKGPDLQDGKTLSEKGMVGMEDGCRSQIPAVTKCFLLLPCRPSETELCNKPVR